MTKDKNARLRIHQCRNCNKICKGSEWKKHKAEEGHTKSWRRLFCTAHSTFKHAHSKSKIFIQRHNGCSVQKSISNANFRQFISDTRRVVGETHNLSPAEDSDEESDYKTEEEDEQETAVKNINTEGESEACLSITEDEDSDFVVDRERERLLEKIQHKKADTAQEQQMKETAPTRADQPVAEQMEQEGSTEAGPTTLPEAGPTTLTEAVPTTSADKPKAKKGIRQQNKAWAKDKEMEAINRESRMRHIYNRFVSLQSQYKAMCEQNTRLKLTVDSSKVFREEVEVQKAANREKSLQVASLQAKVDMLTSRLDYASRHIEELQHENAAAKQAEKKAREEKEKLLLEEKRREIETAARDSQRIELHIPHRSGLIADEILAFDIEDDEDIECYEDASQGVQCMHLILSRNGRKISIRQRNKRKRFCRPSTEPDSRRQRMD